MCRVVGYIGPRLPLAALVDEPPHSLVVQSYAAKELETSVVAADGWGAAWYLDASEQPCVYRSTLPIWGDANRSDLGRAIQSHVLLSAVRSATDPLGIAVGNTQPFKFESLCFVHNGFLEDFAERWMRPLRQSLSEPAYRALGGVTDSEHVFATILDEWLSRDTTSPGARLLNAVEAALRRLLSLSERLGARALLTLLVSDGTHLVAARSSHRAQSPTLYMLEKSEPEAFLFASEPLDSEQTWKPLATGHTCLASLGAPPVESTLS